MKNETTPIVLFDLDGTLADTSGNLLAAANACFRDLGFEDLLFAPKDAPVAMLGGRAMLCEGFSRVSGVEEAEIDRQYPRLLTYYERDVSSLTFLFDGVVEALDELRSAGFGLAVCTNKPEVPARMVLSDLGILDKFDALVAADTLAERKPHALPVLTAISWANGTPERALLLGDTDTDNNAARNANILSVLVTFGPHGRAVEALKPDALLESYADLPALASKMIGS